MEKMSKREVAFWGREKRDRRGMDSGVWAPLCLFFMVLTAGKESFPACSSAWEQGEVWRGWEQKAGIWPFSAHRLQHLIRDSNQGETFSCPLIRDS